MSETPADRFRRLAAAFTETIDAVPAKAWGAQSPCAEWDARGVVQHIVETERELLGRFDQTKDVLPAQTELDPVAAWPGVRDAMQRVIDDPQIAGHRYDGYFGPTTLGETIDQFYAMDLAIHRWDLATAAGLEDHRTIDPDDVDRLLEAAKGFGEAARMPGVYGPEVQVPADAPAQDRLLAFTGRDPGRPS